MAKVDPEKEPLFEGDVVVRVGADSIPCPRGDKHPVYPVVQLIWPSTERQPNPNVEMTIRWQDKLYAEKPSKSSSPKYIGLMMPDGRQWIGYRVSDKDRQQFEQLRQKWGMWFMRVRRQGEDRDAYFTFFNDGGFFAGSIVTQLDERVEEVNAQELRDNLLRAWKDTIDFVAEKYPKMLPAEDILRRRVAQLNKIPGILEEIGGGPLPWKKKEMPWWGKPDNKAHEFAVSTYLMLLKALQQNALNKKAGEKTKHEHAKMYDLLRSAKIFEITPESYVEMHLEVDRHVTEDIAHLPFHHPNDPKVEIPEGEGMLLHKRTAEAVMKLPFPDKMPFETCWFAITGAMAISQIQAFSRGLPDDDGPYMLAGILVTSDGEHHELLLSNKADLYGRDVEMRLYMSTHRVEEEQRWLHPLCLAPFILHFIVDSINDHQSTVISQRKLGFQSQSKLKKGLGDLGIKKAVPPPFYTVYLRDKVIKEIAKGYSGGKLRAKLSHRFDVRGHWCFKIYRGPMPMDVELELHLDNLKYSIYKNRPVDEWVKDALHERDQALPQEGEWIAVKKFWKNSYVKGPDGAQYVPSTRRATKGVLAFDNEGSSSEDDDPHEQAKTPAGSKVA
jgi:hypothetical protein